MTNMVIIRTIYVQLTLQQAHTNRAQSKTPLISLTFPYFTARTLSSRRSREDEAMEHCMLCVATIDEVALNMEPVLDQPSHITVYTYSLLHIYSDNSRM